MVFRLLSLDDPTVHLIWPEVELRVHTRDAFGTAGRQGNSCGTFRILCASMVGGEQRCRRRPGSRPKESPNTDYEYPLPGGLTGLSESCNRDAWIQYHDLRGEIADDGVSRQDDDAPPEGSLEGICGRGFSRPTNPGPDSIQNIRAQKQATFRSRREPCQQFG